MSELRRVGLNLLFLVPGQTGGTEIYARSLVPRLAEARPDLELVAFVNREGAILELGNVKTIAVPVTGRSRPRRVAAEQLRLPGLLSQYSIELLHSLGTSAPARPRVPSVVTIHDLIYRRYPGAHTRTMRLGMRFLVPLAARNATRVITVSHAAAGDIRELLGVPPDRIDVIPEAGKPPGPATDEATLRKRLGLGDAPIVLSVSARRPHKNLPRLLEAFARIDSDPAPLLVLPGYATTFEDPIIAEASRLGIADRVRFLGWVSDEDLEGLYAAALCFAFPSLAEGFGLPVLEAMQRGLPVACSNAASLPEVAGDAVRYFNPLAVDEIAAALRELIESPATREELGRAGIERGRTFSWERAAHETASSYERAWAQAPGNASIRPMTRY